MPRAEEWQPTILCVDDEGSIRSALKRLFLDEPWDVHLARDGQEGLEVFQNNEVDLVLSDFRMPGIDGVEFLKRVKEINPDCVRIVLSGYADINLLVSALNEGEIYRFMGKPWNDENLLHNIRTALEHYRLGRENRRLNAELRQLNAELEKKVRERTRELEAKNKTLHTAERILELLPMPIMGVDVESVVVFANARARALFQDDEELVGGPAPGVFEPELTGAITRALKKEPDEERSAFVLPMVFAGSAVGAIVLIPDESPLDLKLIGGSDTLNWTVTPV